MITMYIHNGLAVKPDDCIHRGSYDPAVGAIIKFIAEDGTEYHIVTCNESGGNCSECVFDSRTGHQLSELFDNTCGPDVTQMFCYDRIYKPIDTIMEDL